MDLLHIFYEEIPADDNFFFCLFANLVESIDLEEVLLKEDQNYMVTGLSLNEKAATDVNILNVNARHSSSDMIRSYEEVRKKFCLDCHFYKKALFDIIIPFKKRRDVLMTVYTYFDTTTN